MVDDPKERWGVEQTGSSGGKVQGWGLTQLNSSGKE